MLPTVDVLRYTTPLREGGSLPGIVEANDLGTYVAKFRGAGQGPGALVAEVVVGALARHLGLPVPDLVVLHLDEAIGRLESDPEIQDLLVASAGPNLGMDYLPGAANWDVNGCGVADDLAARIRWLDAFVGNVDRTWRNPNLMVWHGRPWLIDHEAALPWQHAWGRGDDLDDALLATGVRWSVDLADHALVGHGDVAAVAPEMRSTLDRGTVEQAVMAVPTEWLAATTPSVPASEVRRAHVHVLTSRLADSTPWLDTMAHPALGPHELRGDSTSTRPGWLQ